MEGRGTTIEIENDEDHEAQHTSPLEDDTMIEIRNTEAKEMALRIELVATDRPEKVLPKLVEKQKARYHHKPSRSKRTSIPPLL